MNEFEDKSKEELNKILIALNSYKSGCEDTFKLIEEQHRRTMIFYDQKIACCLVYLDVKRNNKE